MAALVVVSHSPLIAEGILQLTSEIAKEAKVYAVGGTKTGVLGSDFDATLNILNKLTEDTEVVVLTDLGSSRMTAQMAIEALTPEKREKISLSDAALVEGSIAAAAIISAGFDIAGVMEQLEPLNLPK